MLDKLARIYVFLFARRVFSKLNKVLFRLSLGGLGILNYQTPYVSGERAFLKKYLRYIEGFLFDIGANQGDYLNEALQHNPAMKVFAFEPHPTTFKKLSENSINYQNVVLVNKGLSGASGVLNLYDYANNVGSSHASLFEDVITEIHGSSSAVAHEVEVTTLDELVENANIDEMALLKIDTEGNELDVLREGLKTLAKRKIKAIHFEFNEMNVVSRVFFQDFWRMLAGYKFYRLLPNEMLEIKKYSPLACEISAYQNIVAVLEE